MRVCGVVRNAIMAGSSQYRAGRRPIRLGFFLGGSNPLGFENGTRCNKMQKTKNKKRWAQLLPGGGGDKISIRNMPFINYAEPVREVGLLITRHAQAQ